MTVHALDEACREQDQPHTTREDYHAMTPEEEDQLRAHLVELEQLAQALFEAQFQRAGGRTATDPTWDEVDQDEWWEQARNAWHVWHHPSAT